MSGAANAPSCQPRPRQGHAVQLAVSGAHSALASRPARVNLGANADLSGGAPRCAARDSSPTGRGTGGDAANRRQRCESHGRIVARRPDVRAGALAALLPLRQRRELLEERRWHRSFERPRDGDRPIALVGLVLHLSQEGVRRVGVRSHEEEEVQPLSALSMYRRPEGRDTLALDCVSQWNTERPIA